MNKDLTLKRDSSPSIIGQYEDGTWYWRDETYQYGNNVRYTDRASAQVALDEYFRVVLGYVDGENA